ncbi:hypothetical protein E1293_22690 [Actinomadura darangshiensis]|uniref:Uncharacterized protein n=1 Tax=Actinomadura darangshiensis TaxID=705336 RepID=A0A4R5B4H6_9ACTN|nr:hypothetical protein [Actinomadura darangshiensis]TDD79689.1 hypothetical protein E1293_22690 [Actinomadura darangshiensis]
MSGARAERMTGLIDEIGRIFGEDGYEQHKPVADSFGLAEMAPVQRTGFGGSGPPLLVGGTGDTVLRTAARHAGIVGIAETYQVKGTARAVLAVGTWGALPYG